MMWAWIELDGEQAGWGSARVVVAKLGRDGHGRAGGLAAHLGLMFGRGS